MASITESEYRTYIMIKNIHNQATFVTAWCQLQAEKPSYIGEDDRAPDWLVAYLVRKRLIFNACYSGISAEIGEADYNGKRYTGKDSHFWPPMAQLSPLGKGTLWGMILAELADRLEAVVGGNRAFFAQQVPPEPEVPDEI